MTPEEIMQQIQFFNKYSRFLYEKGRRETWGQTVSRTVEFLKKQAGESLDDDTMNAIFMSIFNQEISPSMRLMATAGKSADTNQLGVYNCSFLPLSRVGDLYDLTILLGHGVGVGFSVEKSYVDQWEEVPVFTKNVYNIEIEDSIQGWAFSFLAQLSNALDGFRVSFDYSKIRPAGSPLMTRGGTASGPAPLKQAHEAIQKILEARQGLKLRSVDLFDIACHVAGAIVSGGVRRCLPSGSMVHARRGMVPIEEIEVGEEVLTASGYHKVSNIFEQGSQKLVRVVAQDSSFACTPNHRVAVFDGDDSYVWKAASELRFGDKLIAPSVAVEGSQQKLPDFEYIRPKHSTTCKDIIIPELDAKMAWLLGLLHGDGFVGKKEVTIPIHEDYVEMGQRAAEQLRRFGVNVGVDENEHYFVLRVKSKQLATYFGSWLKQAKTPISVPDFMWGASQDIKLAYVAGVMDADGSAKTRPIQVLVTVYEDFARQIRLLLSSCGVQTRIKKLSEANLEEGWQKKYAVVLINSVAKEIFSEIPELFRSELKIDYNSERFTNKMPSGKVWRKSFSSLIPVNFVRLEDVEEEEETWDLEIEGVHEFFCEGYLVHNSAMIAIFDKSDTDMMTSKSGEWYLDNLQRQYANISFVIDRRMTLQEWQGYVTMMDLNKSGEPGIWSRYAIKRHLPKRRTYVETMGPNPLEYAALESNF